MKLKRQILTGLLSLIVGGVFGQIAPDSLFGNALLKEDLYYLRERILEVHQNPFTYCSEAEFEEAYNRALDQVAEGQQFDEFAQTVAAFLSVLKDSHTSVNFNALTGFYQKADRKVLDIRVKWIGGKLYLLEDKDGEFAPGLEIKSIRGQSAASLFYSVKVLAVSEGYSDNGNNFITEALFPSHVALFMKLESTNEIVFVEPVSGQVIQSDIPAYDVKDMRKKYRRVNYQPFVLHLDEETGIARVQVKSFSAESTNKFHRFLKRSARKIRKSESDKLVIDLRGNTGGQVNRAEMLISLLTDSAVFIPDNILMRQSEFSKRYYERKYKGFTRFVVNHFYKKDEKISSYRRMLNMEVGESDTLAYNKDWVNYFDAFHGEKYVLMDGLTGSASVLFCGAIKNHGLATLVGSSPLGPMTGTWGNPGNYGLKNTKLQVYLSIIRTNTSGNLSTDPSPIQADEQVTITPASIIEGRDEVMERIKEL